MLVDKDAGQAPFCILWVSAVPSRSRPSPPANREHRATRAPAWVPEAATRTAPSLPPGHRGTATALHRVSGKHRAGLGQASGRPRVRQLAARLILQIGD